jgi:hypothetical protein
MKEKGEDLKKLFLFVLASRKCVCLVFLHKEETTYKKKGIENKVMEGCCLVG